MDILVISLWLLGVIITHLLLRRVVEIDTINKELLKQKIIPLVDTTSVEEVIEKEISQDDLQKELLDYVEAQAYDLPKVDYISQPQGLTNVVMTKPIDSSNIVQQFQEERDLNTGTFGDLQAYDGEGFAEL